MGKVNNLHISHLYDIQHFITKAVSETRAPFSRGDDAARGFYSSPGNHQAT